MRKMNIMNVLSFDQHFSQAGFCQLQIHLIKSEIMVIQKS